MKIPFISKKTFKHKHKCCQICDEPEYKLLDTHRIIHGCDGGKYENTNCVCLCTSCHRKHHTGLITVKRWYNSTKGRVLHYIDENGEEQFK
jgi:hypothetical protein